MPCVCGKGGENFAGGWGRSGMGSWCYVGAAAQSVSLPVARV